MIAIFITFASSQDCFGAGAVGCPVGRNAPGRWPLITHRSLAGFGRRLTILSKGQTELLQDSLILGAEVLDTGIEQPNSTVQFDLSSVELEDLIESLAAAINHTESEELRAWLDKIHKRWRRCWGESLPFRVPSLNRVRGLTMWHARIPRHSEGVI